MAKSRLQAREVKNRPAGGRLTLLAVALLALGAQPAHAEGSFLDGIRNLFGKEESVPVFDATTGRKSDSLTFS